MKIILLMLLAWWIGKHISFCKKSRNICYPLGIQIQRWAYVWHISIQCYKYEITIWLPSYGLFPCANFKGIELLPCRRKGVGGIYGTPHGDFEFGFNKFCWWRYEKETK